MEIAKYHMPYLERAAEQNRNNARWPLHPNKGLLECRDLGLIEVVNDPDWGSYFIITTKGEEALSLAIPKQPRRRARLKALPPLVPPLPDHFSKVS